MKNALSVFILFISLFPLSPRAFAESKPFQHAMIFNGGNLDIYQFFGMYDAAVAAGKPPDLIIGTCGGALAASIIKVMPDPKERMEFVKSEKFYEYMKKIKYSDLSLVEVISDLKKVAGQAIEQKNPHSSLREVPNPFYKHNIMSPKNQYYYKELEVPFEKTNPKGPELVIISNEMKYDPKDVGRVALILGAKVSP